ncbi:MAG: sialate O-acetylesterase [Limisphaerales bacterium]
MKLLARILASLVVLLWAWPGALAAETPPPPDTAITTVSPSDYQVFQRTSRFRGSILLSGIVRDAGGRLQFRLTGHSLKGDLPAGWKAVRRDPLTGAFKIEVPVAAGGWYRLELRVIDGGKVVARQAITHVGVGEVFVVAGQSNATNYGAERQQTVTGRVASFDGSRWVVANDPQPGVQDGSQGGSFLPAFGDALCARYDVPIGVASVGCGATSVRQWLMKGEKIEVLPTLTSFVKTVAPNQWEAAGTLFDGLMKRIDRLGPHGFRAILWHQGESDAGQARSGYPADRQISGEQYRRLLEKIIRASQERAGWKFPWFVAQATYHSEQDPSDAEFRQAQKALWNSGVALEGPDTDALAGDYRAGVHFNRQGLEAHGKLWAEKVGVYLDKILAAR